MIILISGVTRTGKTLMAQNLMVKYGFPYISIDHIKMGLYRGLKDEKYNPEQNFAVLAEALWPVIKGIIMTAIENKQNLILEGCYILPHMLSDIKGRYFKEILPVFMVFSDQYIVSKYDSAIKKYQSVIEHRDTDELEPLENLIGLHHDLKQKCQIESIDYFEIISDYEKEIEEVYNFLDCNII